eukprot:6077852-Prorocentrum_lima.AAC.1
MTSSLVGSEMCIRDSAWYRSELATKNSSLRSFACGQNRTAEDPFMKSVVFRAVEAEATEALSRVLYLPR